MVPEILEEVDGTAEAQINLQSVRICSLPRPCWFRLIVRGRNSTELVEPYVAYDMVELHNLYKSLIDFPQ